jgi:hypothetical protein
VFAPEEFTQLLVKGRKGDKSALDAMTPVLYDELRRQAARADPNDSRATNAVASGIARIGTTLRVMGTWGKLAGCRAVINSWEM